jgi:N utilization substance protein A
LQPAVVDEVILCKMMGRAIVLVREDQLSLAIGRRGQNVRLASKLCGWDIEIMTQEELQEQIESAVAGFASIEGVTDDVAERLVGEGFLSYDDLSVIEPEDLVEMSGLPLEVVDRIIEQAEAKAEEAEQAAAAERRRMKEQERIERATAELEAIEGPAPAALPEVDPQEASAPEFTSSDDDDSGLGGVASTAELDTLDDPVESAPADLEGSLDPLEDAFQAETEESDDPLNRES